MAAFPTSAQLSTYGSQGPWSTSTRAGQLSNVGYAEANLRRGEPRSHRLDAARGMDRRRAAAGAALAHEQCRPATREPLRHRGTDARPARQRLRLRPLLLRQRLAGDHRRLASPGCPRVGDGRGARLPRRGSGPVHPGELLGWACTSPSGTTTPGTTTGRVARYAFTPLPIPASTLSNSTADFNGDWNNDVLARWTATGTLHLYAGRGNGRIASPSRSAAAGGRSAHWRPSATSAVTAHSTCSPGTRPRATCGCTGARARAGGPARVRVGTGWNPFNSIIGPGDFDGDQRVDVLARKASTGELFLYAGNGSMRWKALAAWAPAGTSSAH